MLNLLHKHDGDLSQQATIWNVPLPKLEDNPFQTRQINDPDHVLALAASIVQLAPTLPTTRGLQQLPVGRLVRYADGHVWPAEIYEDEDAIANLLDDGGTIVELAFGHSRRLAFLVLTDGVLSVFKEMAPQRAAEWRAEIEYQASNYGAMPLLLRPLTDRQMWEHAITENAQRRDLTAIEEAIAIQRARADLGMTYDEAGKIFGKSRGAAANLVRLLQLPDKVQQLILDGALSERHGRALLRLQPAPHLLDTDAIADMTVAGLERLINWKIAQCQPIAPAPHTGYGRGRPYVGAQHATNVYQFDPPPWPLDWAPATGVANVLGACAGCRFFAHFSGDAGPRCAQDAVDFDTCYHAKDMAWQAQQAAAQQATIERLSGASPSPAGAAPAGNQPATPISAAGVVANATITAQPDAGVTWFSGRGYGSDAPANLLDSGLCSGERCPCYIITYNPLAGEHHVRPDPVGAPNMCAGCTSKQRLANRRLELEHGDVQTHRERIKAEQTESERLLRQAAASAAADELWSSQPFLLDLAKHLNTNRSGIDVEDITALRTLILMALAGRSAKTLDGNQQLWEQERVIAWLDRLGLRGGIDAQK